MAELFYDPIGWTASTPRSGRNMKHMETMYPDLISSIDLHKHINIHYQKAESDARFASADNSSEISAEFIDGKTLNQIIGGMAPNGYHLIWPGDDNDFSNGYLVKDPRWHIADGGDYNGIFTTDMRGYFPRSALTTEDVGSAGSGTLAMSGTVTIQGHRLTLQELPAHGHRYEDFYDLASRYDCYVQGGSGMGGPDQSAVASVGSAGGDQYHDHGTLEVNFNEENKNPLWKGFYFICKVSDT